MRKPALQLTALALAISLAGCSSRVADEVTAGADPTTVATTVATEPIDASQPTAEQITAYIYLLQLNFASQLWWNDLGTFVQRMEAAQASPAPAPATSVRPSATSVRPSPAPVYGGGAANGFLACVKQRESGGNYHAYNPSGAAGAYQVMPGTWNGYGGYASAGQAPPAVQDAFAAQLYARAGRSPWAGGQYAC